MKEQHNESHIIDQLFLSLNCISLICSICITIFIFFTIRLGLKSSQRLSYRLSLWLFLTDVLTHLPLPMILTKNFVLCNSYYILVNLCNLAFLFLVVVLASNLHFVFLLNKTPYIKSERLFVFVVFVITLLFTTPLLVMFVMETKIENTKECPFFMGYKLNVGLPLFFASYFFWLLLGCSYCITIFYKIVKLLSGFKKQSSNSKQSDRCIINNKIENNTQSLAPVILNRLIKRLAFYCIVPVFVLLPYAIILTANIGTDNTHGYFFASVKYLATTCQGTINTFLFLFLDPSFLEVLKEFQMYYHPAKYWSSLVTTPPSCEQNEYSNII